MKYNNYTISFSDKISIMSNEINYDANYYVILRNDYFLIILDNDENIAGINIYNIDNYYDFCYNIIYNYQSFFCAVSQPFCAYGRIYKPNYINFDQELLNLIKKAFKLKMLG